MQAEKNEISRNIFYLVSFCNIYARFYNNLKNYNLPQLLCWFFLALSSKEERQRCYWLSISKIP